MLDKFATDAATEPRKRRKKVAFALNIFRISPLLRSIPQVLRTKTFTDDNGYLGERLLLTECSLYSFLAYSLNQGVFESKDLEFPFSTVTEDVWEEVTDDEAEAPPVKPLHPGRKQQTEEQTGKKEEKKEASKKQQGGKGRKQTNMMSFFSKAKK